jgi:hypothetical protein
VWTTHVVGLLLTWMTLLYSNVEFLSRQKRLREFRQLVQNVLQLQVEIGDNVRRRTTCPIANLVCRQDGARIPCCGSFWPLLIYGLGSFTLNQNQFGKASLIQALSFTGSIFGGLKFPTISLSSCNSWIFLAILVLEERVVFSPFGAPDNSGLVIAEAPASLFFFSDALNVTLV